MSLCWWGPIGHASVFVFVWPVKIIKQTKRTRTFFSVSRSALSMFCSILHLSLSLSKHFLYLVLVAISTRRILCVCACDDELVKHDLFSASSSVSDAWFLFRFVFLSFFWVMNACTWESSVRFSAILCLLTSLSSYTAIEQASDWMNHYSKVYLYTMVYR